MKYLFFDTETNGLPMNYRAHYSKIGNWPLIVQMAWALAERDSSEYLSSGEYLIKPKEGFVLEKSAASIHGKTLEEMQENGVSIENVMDKFIDDVGKADFIVAHNIDFDFSIVAAELLRMGMGDGIELFESKKKICTMKSTVDYCKIPSRRGYKWPRLQQLHKKVFGEEFADAHDAMNDVNATVRCFFNLPIEIVQEVTA